MSAASRRGSLGTVAAGIVQQRQLLTKFPKAFNLGSMSTPGFRGLETHRRNFDGRRFVPEPTVWIPGVLRGCVRPQWLEG